jgi:predicted nuclease of restriction endonuclease-like (RecB) superfamily
MVEDAHLMQPNDNSVDADLMELFARSRDLVLQARGYIGTFASAVTVFTNFELGFYIVEVEQRGAGRAGYGSQVLDKLSEYLTAEFGRGFSRANLGYMRQFYLAYKDRRDAIVQSGIGQLAIADTAGIVQTRIGQSLRLDSFPFQLSWTHYLTLMRIEDKAERDFYEREAIDNAWSVKTLQRQYGSSLYERLALSRNKDEVMRLANEGATPQKPADLIKRPYVLEFVGLEDKPAYHESDLETAVVNHLQDFLLEMGKGFLFERRQKRFSFADRDYYLDLVLYNRFLRCYVLVDFKADILSHQDLGQMQMYVNYYDRYEKLPEENPTVGILLCKRSDQALVELTLPKDAHIYAAEYRLYLPSKELLQAKLAEWLRSEES